MNTDSSQTALRRAPEACIPVAALLGVLLLTIPSHAADRSQETDPNWRPGPERSAEADHPRRVYLGDKRYSNVKPGDCKDARNPNDAAKRINAMNQGTIRTGLDVYREDRLSGVGFYQPSNDPRETWADRGGRDSVEGALRGNSLNTDPRSLAYLRNSARAINVATITRNWEWAFGSERFFRASATGALDAGVGAGNATCNANGRIVVTVFNKTRELASANLKAAAPAKEGAVKSSVLTAKVLGRQVLSDTVTDTKPFSKSRDFKVGQGIEWKNGWGRMTIPWFGLGLDYGASIDPVTITPRIALGNASAAGDVALGSRLQTTASVPLASLWGFATILARVDFCPIEGKVFGGQSIGLAWTAGAKPVVRDSRYVRTAIGYGDVNLKIKAEIGFSLFDWKLWKKDKTLWSVFKHDGRVSEHELLSQVRETALR